MRVISGIWKGKKIDCPDSEITRPTSDKVRESLFNIIQHNYKSIENSYIADLCAGSGSMGIECLSRGAQKVTFVEKHSSVLQVLKKNLYKINSYSKSNIIKCDVKNLPESNYIYDYIFLDPPYNQILEVPIFKQLYEKKWVSSESIVCLETESACIPDQMFYYHKINERSYGRSGISFWKIDDLKI